MSRAHRAQMALCHDAHKRGSCGRSRPSQWAVRARARPLVGRPHMQNARAPLPRARAPACVCMRAASANMRATRPRNVRERERPAVRRPHARNAHERRPPAPLEERSRAHPPHALRTLTRARPPGARPPAFARASACPCAACAHCPPERVRAPPMTRAATACNKSERGPMLGAPEVANAESDTGPHYAGMQKSAPRASVVWSQRLSRHIFSRGRVGAASTRALSACLPAAQTPEAPRGEGGERLLSDWRVRSCGPAGAIDRRASRGNATSSTTPKDHLHRVARLPRSPHGESGERRCADRVHLLGVNSWSLYIWSSGVESCHMCVEIRRLSNGLLST